MIFFWKSSIWKWWSHLFMGIDNFIYIFWFEELVSEQIGYSHSPKELMAQCAIGSSILKSL